MDLAWDRRTHTWDDEIILRTMMLGDIGDYRKMITEVSRDRLWDVFQRKSYEIDVKSQVFWGHILHLTPSKTGFFHPLRMNQLHLDILPSNQREILPLLASLKPDWCLAGGTALALQIGHL